MDKDLKKVPRFIQPIYIAHTTILVDFDERRGNIGSIHGTNMDGVFLRLYLNEMIKVCCKTYRCQAARLLVSAVGFKVKFLKKFAKKANYLEEV